MPYEHGTSLTRALQQAGAKAEMVPAPQGKHGFPKETLDMPYTQYIWRDGHVQPGFITRNE